MKFCSLWPKQLLDEILLLFYYRNNNFTTQLHISHSLMLQGRTQFLESIFRGMILECIVG